MTITSPTTPSATTATSATSATSEEPRRIVLLVASTRSPRLADPLLAWLRPHLETRADVVLDVVDLAVERLHEHELVPGGARTGVSDRLAAADGFLVLVPEYNHSFPAPLKHALDLHLAEWARKPFAFVGYGGGSGGIRAVEQLRQILPELRAASVREAVHLPQPWDRLDAQGRFQPAAGGTAALDATLDELLWWARALRTARAAGR